jgi:short-subunit dehydrogenase
MLSMGNSYSEYMKFKGKTVLITGASSGIGKDFALRIAQDGARVILASRSKENLEKVKSEIEKEGGSALVVPTDVSKREEVRELFLKASDDGSPIDLVLNNAGLGFIAKIYELTAEEIETIIDVNIKGMLFTAKFASEVMTRQRAGHIIFVSSLAGLITLPQWSAYVASKWAVTSFADCIRPELKPFGIKVTTIHPGAVRTEFFDKDKADVDISKLGSAIEVDAVTDAIYNSSFTNKKKVILPFSSKAFASIYRVSPAIAEKLISQMTKDAEYHENTKEDEPEFSYIKPLK